MSSTDQHPDSQQLVDTLGSIAERSQRLVVDFMRRCAERPTSSPLDPLNITGAFIDMTIRLMSNPTKLLEAQTSLWMSYLKLWENATSRMLGGAADPVVTPDRKDHRFRDDVWTDNEAFDFIKQSYLLTARWLRSVVGSVEGLDEEEERKVDFYTRQFIDAMAPTNFVMTNPAVLRATVESGGENLLNGLQNLLSDLERGQGRLAVSTTDESAFRVGENIATTPGAIIFQNDMMQLIQYRPTTKNVSAVPTLITPPWINKYYVLDLRPENSYVKWCVDQGMTVFIISWVNPDRTLANKSFEDYMREGVLAAIDVICEKLGCDTVNAVGYCLGGTLLASTAAWRARHKDDRLASITLFCTLLDFSRPGDVGVFIDETQLKVIEAKMRRDGYLDGADMGSTFSLLRENDMIWSFVVNNYLLGHEPLPFDLLYWNGDTTRLPAAMHSFYLRNMYLHNKLIEPNGITLCGDPIDLGQITCPVYMLSCEEDHIALWTSTYLGTRALKTKVRFVLSSSGHIGGVINPPAAHKHCYWTNGRTYKDPALWLKNARRHQGSWWEDWARWLKTTQGEEVPARDPNSSPIIEAAPGSYVKVRTASSKLLAPPSPAS